MTKILICKSCVWTLSIIIWLLLSSAFFCLQGKKIGKENL